MEAPEGLSIETVIYETSDQPLRAKVNDAVAAFKKAVDEITLNSFDGNKEITTKGATYTLEEILDVLYHVTYMAHRQSHRDKAVKEFVAKMNGPTETRTETVV